MEVSTRWIAVPVCAVIFAAGAWFLHAGSTRPAERAAPASPEPDAGASPARDLESRLAALVARAEALQARNKVLQQRAQALREGGLEADRRRRLDARFQALPLPRTLRDPGAGRDLTHEPGVPEQVLRAYEAETGISDERIRALMQDGSRSTSTP